MGVFMERFQQLESFGKQFETEVENMLGKCMKPRQKTSKNNVPQEFNRMPFKQKFEQILVYFRPPPLNIILNTVFYTNFNDLPKAHTYCILNLTDVFNLSHC